MDFKVFIRISFVYFTTTGIQRVNSELQELIKSAYLRSQEIEAIRNRHEVLIANQSKIIEEQRQQIANFEGRFFHN